MKKQGLNQRKYGKGQKKTRKKTVAAMVMASLTLSLAGCGSSGQSQTSNVGTQTVSQTQSEALEQKSRQQTLLPPERSQKPEIS